MYKKITSNMTDPVDNNNQIAIFMEISGWFLQRMKMKMNK